MEPLVVYIFDHPDGYQSVMEQQLDKAGVERLSVVLPEFSWAARIKKTIEVANAYPSRPLFFVDAWDTLFLGQKWELEATNWQRGITFASQKACWPDSVEREYNIFYEYSLSTRWRYLNSNPMAGLGVNIADALQWGWDRFPLKGGASTTTDPSGEVCERFYTNLLFQAPREWELRIDTQCALAQTCAEGSIGELAIRGGRISNMITNTQPLFFHLNSRMPFDLELLNG